MAYKYSRYIGRVTRQPWAITPEKFLVLADLMQLKASGETLSDEEIAARIGDGEMRAEVDRERRGQEDGSVAVIPIVGVIAYRGESFAASSGGTSVQALGRAVKMAATDETIKSVILDIDSPGGSVEGIPELAAQIAQLAAIKPVTAHINALAASAAYWLASQATEIVSMPSGAGGSIGVYMLTVDESEALVKEGIKVNAISYGDYKLEGAPWEPLSDEGRAHLQAQVDAVGKIFVMAVAKGRGVTAAEVQKNFGQGRVYSAKEMLTRGMIDRIATFDETLAKMVRARPAAVAANLSVTPLMMSLVEPEPSVEPIEAVGEGKAKEPAVDDTEAILAALVTDEV